jgi:hypothetical protein
LILGSTFFASRRFLRSKALQKSVNEKNSGRNQQCSREFFFSFFDGQKKKKLI